MASSQEQESQFDESLYDMADTYRKLPTSRSPSPVDSHYSDHILEPESNNEYKNEPFDTNQDSLKSIVQDTQYIDLELDTQAHSSMPRKQSTPNSSEINQDSLRSVVADTQFVNMELDTQAVNDSLDKSFGNDTSVGVTETGPCPNSITQTANGLFSRSNIPLPDDVGFRFGRVNLRQPQVFRPVFNANFIIPENSTDATALHATTSNVPTIFASEFAGGKDNRSIQSGPISNFPTAPASNIEQGSAISPPHELAGGNIISSMLPQSIPNVGAPATASTAVTTRITTTSLPCELPEGYEDLPGQAGSAPLTALAEITSANPNIPPPPQCAKTMASVSWAKQRQYLVQSAQIEETPSPSHARSDSETLRHESLSVTELPLNKQMNKHLTPAMETKPPGYNGLKPAKEPYRQALNRACVVEDNRLIASKTPMASPFPHRSTKSRHKIKQPFPEESPRRRHQQYQASSYRAPEELRDAQISDSRPPLHEMSSNTGRTRTPITDTEFVETSSSCDRRQSQNVSISIKDTSSESEHLYHSRNDLRHQLFPTHTRHQVINSPYVDDTSLPDTQRAIFPDGHQGNAPASATVTVLGTDHQQQPLPVSGTPDDCSNAPVKEHEGAAIKAGHEYAGTLDSVIRHVTGSRNSNATVQGIQNNFLQPPGVDVDRNESQHFHQTSPHTKETQPRPPSPQSNCGHSMARPISAAGQVFRGVDKSAALSPKHSNKIRKSNHGQPTQKSSGLQHMQMTLLDFEARYTALLEEVQTQREVISGLEITSHNKDEEIKKLKLAEIEAAEALKKLKALQSRYEKHMDEVIASHRFLKTQAKKIAENTAAAKEAEKNSEEMVEKARKAIADVKSIESKTQSMLKNALEKINGLVEENSTLVAALATALAAQNAAEKSKVELKDTLGNAHKLEREALAAKEAVKHNELTNKYTKENQELTTQLADANRENHFHKQLVEERVNELGRERATSDQLQKALSEQSALCHALNDVLDKLPSEIQEKLTTEDGQITKLLSAMNVTQAKIDENTSLINSIKNTDSLAPLAKLVGDLFSNLENAATVAADNDHILRESHAQFLEDIKQGLSQLRLEKDKEISLNIRITELTQINKALTTEKNTRERDIQSMTKKLDEVGHDLTICQAQLSSKNEELLAAIAIPKEDPRLQAKIQELDGIIGVLNSKYEGSKREVSTLKEQLNSLRETFNRKEQENQGFEQELNTARVRINNFAEEKNRYLASKDLENKQICQDLTRKAESSKATMKLKLESEVRNMEQKIKDKDSELNLAKEELRYLQSEKETAASNTAKVQAEVDAYKEQLIQQSVHLQRLQATSQQTFETNQQDLQTIQMEVAELRDLLHLSLDEMASKADKISEANSLVEASARQATQSQKSKEDTEEQCSNLQNELSRKEEQCASLKRELEATSAVVRNMAGGLSRVRTNEHMVASSMTVSTTSRIISQKNEVPRTYVNFQKPSETEKGGFEIPRDHLRQATKHVDSSSHGQNKRGQSVLVGFTSPEHHAGLNGHKLELQPDISSRRPLRAAVRSSSNSGMQKIVEAEIDIAKTPQEAELPSTNYKGRLVKNAHFTPEKSSYITPFSVMSPSTHDSSDLTDMDQIIDGLDDVINNEQLQDVYGKARNGRTKGEKESDHCVSAAQYTKAARKRNEPSVSLISSNEVEEPSTKRVKTRAFTALSTAEESRRRRDSKPGKSVLKKSKEAKAQEYDESVWDLNYIFESQPIGFTQTSNRQPYEARSRVQDLEPRSIRGVVSGKGGRSGGAMAENREFAGLRGSTALSKPSGIPKSPIMREPRRNQRILSSSSSSSNPNAASWKMPAGRVISSYPPRAEVPETQDMY